MAAALLHDFLEHVPAASSSCLDDIFPPKTVALVIALTKVDYHRLHPEGYIAQMQLTARVYPEVRGIKLADRRHNVATCQAFTAKRRLAYLEESLTWFIPFFEEGRGTSLEYDDLLDELFADTVQQLAALRAASAVPA